MTVEYSVLHAQTDNADTAECRVTRQQCLASFIPPQFLKLARRQYKISLTQQNRF